MKLLKDEKMSSKKNTELVVEYGMKIAELLLDQGLDTLIENNSLNVLDIQLQISEGNLAGINRLKAH